MIIVGSNNIQNKINFFVKYHATAGYRWNIFGVCLKKFCLSVFRKNNGVLCGKLSYGMSEVFLS